MPWILISLVAIAIVGFGMAIVTRKTARLGPSSDSQETPTISDRKAILIGLGLMVTAVLTIGLTDMAMWFLPVILYLTVWIPQVSRKAASPRQGILVSTMFTLAMVASVAIRVFVID